MTFKLGLTGSIGMGKSTTAQMFAELGCAVWDADAAVHGLYGKGGAAVPPIMATFEGVVENGAVSRCKLKALILQDPNVLKKIEQIVHPLVASDREKFLDATTEDIAVFDIPLLFETGGNIGMDAVVCVSVKPQLQKKRVMERGTMTENQFLSITEKQLPNDEKCARSDYVVNTETLAGARAQVQKIVSIIKGQMAHA